MLSSSTLKFYEKVMERLTISPHYNFRMANLFNDDMMEVEELFVEDISSMRVRHIETAKRDYQKLKQLGYVTQPSELRIGEFGWVDISSYLKPLTKMMVVGENMEIRLLRHPCGKWTYGLSIMFGTSGWSFLPWIFTRLCNSESEASDAAINDMIRFRQNEKKTDGIIKKLRKRLTGNLQLDLFAGFVF